MSIVNSLASKHNWNLPTVCPVCGSPLSLSENHIHLSCTNQYCPSRISGTISKWCSVMDIKEMGLTTIMKIQEQGFFKTIGAMYKELAGKEIDSIMLPILGKNWTNIRKEFENHKDMTLAKLIAGYNIQGIGEKQVAKIISAKSIKNLSEFKGKNKHRFICDGIGDVLSIKLHDGIETNYNDMKETIKHVNIIKEKEVIGGKLNGQSFCFTGAMEYKRKDLQDMVTANGGINFDSVNKNLTYLVMQDPNSTSTKAQKARTLGIKLISPQEFLKMVQ